MKECIFCKIAIGSVPSYKIWETDSVLGVLDILPASKGHVIIFPKEHLEKIESISDNILKEIVIAIKALCSAIYRAFNPKGIHIVVNEGEIAGQTVKHFSVNIIPRYGNEKVVCAWEKRSVSPEELVQIQQVLLKALQQTTIAKEGEKKEEKIEDIEVKYLSSLFTRK